VTAAAVLHARALIENRFLAEGMRYCFSQWGAFGGHDCTVVGNVPPILNPVMNDFSGAP
jgi:hypothetical protein